MTRQQESSFTEPMVMSPVLQSETVDSKLADEVLLQLPNLLYALLANSSDNSTSAPPVCNSAPQMDDIDADETALLLAAVSASGVHSSSDDDSYRTALSPLSQGMNALSSNCVKTSSLQKSLADSALTETTLTDAAITDPSSLAVACRVVEQLVHDVAQVCNDGGQQTDHDKCTADFGSTLIGGRERCFSSPPPMSQLMFVNAATDDHVSPAPPQGNQRRRSSVSFANELTCFPAAAVDAVL